MAYGMPPRPMPGQAPMRPLPSGSMKKPGTPPAALIRQAILAKLKGAMK